MLQEIKLLLGATAANYTDEQVSLAFDMALAEVEAYCNREADIVLRHQAARIAVIKLNRINTEGLASQAYSGVSEAYIDGYPADILSVLNSKRKLRVV